MNVAEWEMLAKRYPCGELKNAKGESADAWITCVARIAFEKVTAPDNGKYSCALIFPPQADLGELMDAARRTAVAKWGDKVKQIDPRSPFKEQASVAGKYEGFADAGYYVNASSKFAPDFYAADGRSALTLSPDLLWSGCYVRVGLTCYTYDKDAQGKSVKPGVSFGLKFIQFIAAGEKFSGGLNATEYLQPIEGLPAVSAPAAHTPAAAAKPITGALF